MEAETPPETAPVFSPEIPTAKRREDYQQKFPVNTPETISSDIPVSKTGTQPPASSPAVPPEAKPETHKTASANDDEQNEDVFTETDEETFMFNWLCYISIYPIPGRNSQVY